MLFYWSICCNLEVRLRVVKAESVLQRERLLQQGLKLNVYYREGRGDVLGEVLALTAWRYLRCFYVVGDILLKYCVVYG